MDTKPKTKILDQDAFHVDDFAAYVDNLSNISGIDQLYVDKALRLALTQTHSVYQSIADACKAGNEQYLIETLTELSLFSQLAAMTDYVNYEFEGVSDEP